MGHHQRSAVQTMFWILKWVQSSVTTHTAYSTCIFNSPILLGDVGLIEEVGDEGKKRKKRNS